MNRFVVDASVALCWYFEDQATPYLPRIHLDDAVSATIAALDHAPAGSVYDIVDDQPVSMSEIVKAIAEYTRSPKPFSVPACALKAKTVPRFLL